jgi:hypothetical protein
MASASPASSGPVEVEVLVDGLVHDQIAHRKGAVLTFSAADAERLGRHAKVRTKPLVKMKVPNRMVGTKVCAIGEEAYAPTWEMAKEWHVLGIADVINAHELGVPLPPRKSDLRAREGPKYKVKTRSAVLMMVGPGHPAGAIVSLPLEEAQDWITRGIADAIDPMPPA